MFFYKNSKCEQISCFSVLQEWESEEAQIGLRHELHGMIGRSIKTR